MTKSALFLAFTATFFFTGCKVTKQIQKSESENESASKVDSSAVIKKDVTKEETVKTVITEKVDTAVTEPGFTAVVRRDTVLQDGTRVEFKGSAVTIIKPTRKIHVNINKRTETTAESKEVDKSKSNTAVKKKEEKKEETKAVTKDITKTGISFWWWILIVIAALAALAWRFRKFFGW
jgi:hypothetical protein